MLSENQVLPEIVALQLELQAPMPGMMALGAQIHSLDFQITSPILLAGIGNSEFQQPALLALNRSLIPFRISVRQALLLLWPEASRRRIVKASLLSPFAKWIFQIKVFISNFLEKMFPQSTLLKSRRDQYE